MEFDAIILNHMGKDIYIGMEIPEEHRRREAVFHNYQVLSPEGKAYAGEETGIICSQNDSRNFLRLEMRAGVERQSSLFDMIDIEARYQRYFYHIYIMNSINVHNHRRFIQKQDC